MIQADIFAQQEESSCDSSLEVLTLKWTIFFEKSLKLVNIPPPLLSSKPCFKCFKHLSLYSFAFKLELHESII